MAIQQPISSDYLNSPPHSLSHRVFANDNAAPVQTVVVDANGKVGIGTIIPVSLFEIQDTDASPILSITNKSDTDTYDPQIAFRTGATPANRMLIWLDDSDSDKLKFSPLTTTTYPSLVLGTTGKSEINILDNDTESLMIKEATNKYLTFDTTDGSEKVIVGKDLEIGLVKVDTNSGAVNFIDMDVTNIASNGTEESLSIAIDGNALLKVYVESDGAGGIKNKRLDVDGNIYPLTDDIYYLGKDSYHSPKAWKGLILKDTTDGKYYKIVVTNGSIIVASVSSSSSSSSSSLSSSSSSSSQSV
jgi:hypothetical protein